MKKDANPDAWRQATRMVRGGAYRSDFDETSESIFATSGYVYDSAEEAEKSFKGDLDRYIYSRYANPTVAMFERRLALMEGADHAMAFASGMAAMFASLASFLKAGDRVVASRALFGSCLYVIQDLLPKYGVEKVLVDGTDMAQWEKALAPPAAAVFLETPSNPCLDIIDIQAVADLAHKAGARLIVDNVFATPVLQKPLELGADIVMYSTTKHIDGQGRSMGGAIITNDEAYYNEALVPWMRHTGPAISPFNAWTQLKGLETLDIRVRQHCANARAVAEFLEGQVGIVRVLYPGLTSHPQHALAMRQMADGATMLSFEVEGGKAAAFKCLNALELIDISNNLGDAKSLVTHPATTTHQRLTQEDRDHLKIGDGLIRLSVGLEDAGDLKEDLARGLKAAKG
ncbi:MAG: O-succinylhomoserine sulfhydrylase [Rhodospirillaceae bacterium]